MTDLTFDVQAARRRARRRVWLLRVGFLGILALFGVGFVILGRLVFEQIRWISDVPEIAMYLVAGPLVMLWEASKSESLALSSCTAVARMLGAREISARSPSEAEHALRNVTEEVAIAAGVTVPRLYIVQNQTGINALAVGSDTVRGGVFVTSSAVEELSRDALQAVVAHEMAHLITGDAALHAVSGGASAGLRATLAPIRAAARGIGGLLTGRYGLLNDGPRHRFSLVLAAWCLAVGPLALWVVLALTATTGTLLISGDVLRAAATLLLGTTVLGGFGWLLARSTDLAVSKESEYGADALAVEMTRHPDALAEALRAIRDSPMRGLVLSSATARLRPFFFARADTDLVSSGRGSHPSPDERLSALKTLTAGRRWHAPDRTRSLDAPTLTRAAPDPLGDASRLLDTLPHTLCDAAHDPRHVEALVYALLVCDDPDRRHMQLFAAPFIDADWTKRYHNALYKKPTAARLALIALALPTLRRLSSSARQRILHFAPRVAGADGRMTVRETAICEVIHHALAPPRHRRRPTAPQVMAAASALVGALALSGDPTRDGMRRAYHAGATVLHDGLPGTPRPLERPDQARLRAALTCLAGADDAQKDIVLDATRVTLWTDGRALDGEADLVRAIALVLDRPSLLPFGAADRAEEPATRPPAFA